MSDWDWGRNEASGVRLDMKASLDEQLSRLKSAKGGTIRRGSHNHIALAALHAGLVINDYDRRPLMPNGRPLNNVRSRIAALRNDWNIVIGARTVDGENHKEYVLWGVHHG